ncbi:glycosyltransferase [Streptomyces sp. NPDC055109]
MIGYYVHHQGRGHLHRAVCLAIYLRTPVTGLSSLPRPKEWPGDWIRLPMDDGQVSEVGDPRAHGRLHWVPRHHAGLRTRMSIIADWIERSAPSLLVSDVSVEVAAFARLMGVPVVVAAMRGERADPAHRLAYDVADALLAPWPEATREPGWPEEWYAKTEHTGAFSRYDERPRHPGAVPADHEAVVMLGAGGSGVSDADLQRAAEATPTWNWTVLGRKTWTDDPWPLLCGASVVVSHAGQNAIAECAAARTPTLVIPQHRPHGEQHATGRALAAAGLAVVRDKWPEPGEWPALLAGARRMGGDRWSRWAPGDGAERGAVFLDRLAEGLSGAFPGRKDSASSGPMGSSAGEDGVCAPR